MHAGTCKKDINATQESNFEDAVQLHERYTLSLIRMGRTKAKVFPDPVGAQAKHSRPYVKDYNHLVLSIHSYYS